MFYTHASRRYTAANITQDRSADMREKYKADCRTALYCYIVAALWLATAPRIQQTADTV